MKNKFGPYITKLMTTVKDFKEDEFVRDLAVDELVRLNVNIEEFIRSQYDTSDKESTEKPCCAKNKCKSKKEKQLLQEEKDAK